MEVDVGVAEGPPGDHVPAHPDGQDGARGGELLEEHRLGDLRGEVTHVQACHGVVGPGLGGGRLESHLSLVKDQNLSQNLRTLLPVIAFKLSFLFSDFYKIFIRF